MVDCHDGQRVSGNDLTNQVTSDSQFMYYGVRQRLQKPYRALHKEGIEFAALNNSCSAVNDVP